jgi:hypothetical protein
LACSRAINTFDKYFSNTTVGDTIEDTISYCSNGTIDDAIGYFSNTTIDYKIVAVPPLTK